jgi:hypothetical protein
LEVQARRDADPLARSVPRSDNLRDPFATLQRPATASGENAAAQEDEDGERPPAAVAEQLAEPAKLGLVLESIAYSSSRRCAQINGKTVREQDELNLSGQDKAANRPETKLVAKVVSIGRSEVKLEIRGQEVQLKLQSKYLGETEIVERSR